MYISNLSRTLKLACALIRSPRYIPRYIRFHRFLGVQPVDIELPWWSFGAIDYISEKLCKRPSVFEFGSGGSTLFFLRRGAEVSCVEDDPAWAKKVSERITMETRKRVRIKLAALDLKNEMDVYNSDYLKALQGFHDLIVVDGQDYGGLGVGRLIRPACFATAEEHIKPNGMIVVDDSWRLTELRAKNRAKEVRVFESVGPCRTGVTSTDVYIY